MKIACKATTLQVLGDYWRLLWELSVACPIPYISEKALPEKVILEEQKALEAYKFKVAVDGLELRKPVLLTGNKWGYTVKRIEPQEIRVYGKRLRFHGYIVVQEGAQLQPDELRGILIRIRNVAIGYYDPSLLDYRINEGPRSRWLTGEVFVEEGLEDALNIDRDSFNRFHPEFRALQERIHSILAEVFSEVYKQIDVRSKSKSEERQQGRETCIREVIAENLQRRVKISYSEPGGEADALPQVRLSDNERGVNIILPEPSSLKTKSANRQLAAAILAVFEVARMEKGLAKHRGAFTRMLLDLVKW